MLTSVYYCPVNILRLLFPAIASRVWRVPWKLTEGSKVGYHVYVFVHRRGQSALWRSIPSGLEQVSWDALSVGLGHGGALLWFLGQLHLALQGWCPKPSCRKRQGAQPQPVLSNTVLADCNKASLPVLLWRTCKCCLVLSNFCECLLLLLGCVTTGRWLLCSPPCRNKPA